MTSEQIQMYLIPVLILGYIFWSQFRYKKVKKQLPALLNQGAVIVDVRSEAEFLSGANPNSLNIPLEKITEGWRKLDPNKPVIVVCRSGNRSGFAARTLKQKGFNNVVNAGPWTNTL